MAIPGYHGQYLRVQLSATTQSSIHSLSENVLRRYIGGAGLGAYLMLQHAQSPDDDPIIFSFSPLVGSPLTTSAKFAVVCRSPLTHRFNDALSSSGFAIAGKATGFDAIVIDGAAAEPSVLIIDDGQVRLEAAPSLWGLQTSAAEATLRKQLGAGFEIAVIGPAGEKQVRFASISNDGRHAGRGGSGAVMGSKNIKAIAVRGTHRCEFHDPKGLVGYARDLSNRSLGPGTAKYRELGTASNLLAFNRLNTLPTRNFQQGTFESAELLAPETLAETREKTRASCRVCNIGCEHLYQLGDSSGRVRLEYENLFALGPLCGVSDSESVLQASKLCDELGMDTISAGGTIAFAMECVERGLLDENWLQFGDAKALLTALSMTAARDDFGNQLANGSRALARLIGQESARFAPHVKGLELPGYEPRTLQSMALGFAVGTRGADHNRSSAYEVDFSSQVDRRDLKLESIPQIINVENRATLLDSLILCKFLRGVFDDLWSECGTMLQLVTGWNVTVEELKTTAGRIIDAKKEFNIRQGWTPAEDTLPGRFFDDPLPDDTARLTREKLSRLVVAYNLARGWDEDGFLSTSVEP